MFHVEHLKLWKNVYIFRITLQRASNIRDGAVFEEVMFVNIVAIT